MSATLSADHRFLDNPANAGQPSTLHRPPVAVMPMLRMLPKPPTVYGKPANWSAIGLISLVHVLIVVALLQMDAFREKFLAPTPLSVNLIPEQAPAKPQDNPPTLKKLMEIKTPITQAPVLPTVVQSEIQVTQAEPTITTLPPSPAPKIPAPGSDEVAIPKVVPPDFVAAYLDNPAPAYPAVSRRTREQGKVLLRVLVNPQGRADKVEIQTSSGFTRLDIAAQTTVEKWRFVPARQGVQPVAAWVIVPVDFQLS